jgi:hypothetical protein
MGILKPLKMHHTFLGVFENSGYTMVKFFGLKIFMMNLL